MAEIMENYECDICIIGAGPAGLNAAIYCGRANRNTIVLEGKEKGAMEITKDIQNWLGEKKIKGLELLKKFREHASSNENVRIIKGDVISLMLGMGKNMISTRSANITAQAVIICTGRGIRKELIEGETQLIGYGVSYCALCDGPLYRERSVFLYGDDEEVLEDALALDQMGCNASIITKKSIADLPPKIKDVKETNIPIYDNTEIVKVQPGSSGILEKIVVKSTKSDETKELELDGLFILSHVPSNSIFKKAGVELDELGNIKVDENQKTNLEGVYAAGDVTGGLFQVIFAAAEGARAGITAAKYVRQTVKK
ncbi:MAG: Thioredoxin reductase [Promethearchaeota archaeon]|nr:MAG: Thioredoxin reductase [Candidatus Lokiarchaeota archaeon]